MELHKVILLACLTLGLEAGCRPVPAPPASLSRDWGVRRTFDYQGIKINYYDAGQGPPVLLLHGFGGCAYTWRYLIPPLAAAHRVLTLELKGFGLSDKPLDGHYAVADQAKMVAAFIRRQDLHDLVIMGHSLGGGVALMTYLGLQEDDPGRIDKLVLIDSAGYRQKLPWFIRLAKIPGADALGALLPPRFAADLVLKKCYYHKDRITEEQIDTYAYYGSLPGAREAISQTAKQILPKDIDRLTEQYKGISVPVLVIWGVEDEVVPLRVGLLFKRDIPGAELVPLSGCGHIPPEEEPQATRQAIMDFLKK
ncbi:MAG: alpha/beta fold hydrolase [Desulfobaccales bacterium]|jgi:pimeloyl-ACP methyl ester carboxylesterase